MGKTPHPMKRKEVGCWQEPLEAVVHSYLIMCWNKEILDVAEKARQVMRQGIPCPRCRGLPAVGSQDCYLKR